MARCFQLIDLKTNEPAVLADVDDRIRAALGVEGDPNDYYEQWYDILGLNYASGQKPAQMRARIIAEGLDNPKLRNLLIINDFIEANYQVDCWG